MKISGLDIDDDGLIGFVVACLFTSAIDLDELKQWAVGIVGENGIDDFPYYIFEIIDFDEPLMHIYEKIGFAPDSGLTDDEYFALHGIASLRGRLAEDSGIDEKLAKVYVLKYPNVLKRFKEIFPFVDISVGSE